MFKTYHSVFGFFSKINIKSQKIPGGQRLGCERDELSPGKLNNHCCQILFKEQNKILC